MSDPSSSDDSGSSEDIYYRSKGGKKKKHRKKDPIKLCATLMENLLTAAFKSKIIRFKMDEDPIQRRIYLLIFVESLEMIVSHNKENCEVLLYHPKILGDDIIEDYAKKNRRNILYANIDAPSRRLVAEFPKYGIQCIEKLQSHCANMTIADKTRYDRTFQ